MSEKIKPEIKIENKFFFSSKEYCAFINKIKDDGFGKIIKKKSEDDKKWKNEEYIREINSSIKFLKSNEKEFIEFINIHFILNDFFEGFDVGFIFNDSLSLNKKINAHDFDLETLKENIKESSPIDFILRNNETEKEENYQIKRYTEEYNKNNTLENSLKKIVEKYKHIGNLNIVVVLEYLENKNIKKKEIQEEINSILKNNSKFNGNIYLMYSEKLLKVFP